MDDSILFFAWANERIESFFDEIVKTENWGSISGQVLDMPSLRGLLDTMGMLHRLSYIRV